MRNSFVSKDSVKAFFRQGELRVSKDLYAALDAEVRHLLDKAAKRATANGRTTMLPYDL
jgi:TRAP-type C4-dicarboxylate transport system substrate-binding protein